MKSNRDRVLEFLKTYYAVGQGKGITTQNLANQLKIQRSNISTILNSLHQEGLVRKTDGRPVHYYAELDASEAADISLKQLLGHDGSLQWSVQLAKAAVLYPHGSLSVLICGSSGTGKKSLVKKMIEYGTIRSIFPENTSIVEEDVILYQSDEELYNKVLSDDCTASKIAEGKRVHVFINAHLLEPTFLRRLTERLEQQNGSGAVSHILIFLCKAHPAVCDDLKKSVSISIEIPDLDERPLRERKEFIQQFLTIEAERAHRAILVSPEIMRCLMLYRVEDNIAQLKYDIKLACANAFVREYINEADTMQLYLSDFEHYVRKGFIHYHAKRDEIDQLVNSKYTYKFGVQSVETLARKETGSVERTFYGMIAQRSKEFVELGIAEEDIQLLLKSEMEDLFDRYQANLSNRVSSDEHLARLASPRTVQLVRDFLESASQTLEGFFPSSVLYSLCLHIDDGVSSGWSDSICTPKQLQYIRDRFPSEYDVSREFAVTLSKEFGVHIPQEEIGLVALFISKRTDSTDSKKNPVVLYAFSSPSIADSLASYVSSKLKLDNTYSLGDISANNPVSQYDKVKAILERIDRGKGVLAFYDSEKMRNLLRTAELETQIKVRKIWMPIADFFLEVSHRAATETEIDALFADAREYTGMFLDRQKSAVIITLCETGKGGAVELKRYLERNGIDTIAKILALSTAGRPELEDAVSKIMERADVQCFVGTRDPHLYGIPFIPISHIFECSPDKLIDLFELDILQKEKRAGLVNYNEINQYLEENLVINDIGKLKKHLPRLIERINTDIKPLSVDTEIGLYIHIACSIERYLSKENMPVCLQKTQIIDQYKREYKLLCGIVKPLEKAFSILFSDDELAIILSIIFYKETCDYGEP